MSVYTCMRRSVTNALRETAILVALLVLVGCPAPTVGDGNGSNDTGSDGSIASPVSIGSADGGTTTYNGQVDDRANSYYVAVVSDRKYYQVQVTGNTEDVDINVFSDASFTIQIAGETLTTDDVARADGTYLYVEIVASLGVDTGYSLAVTELSDAPGPENATDFGTITTSSAYDGTVNGDTYDIGYDAKWYAFTIGTSETVRIETSELSAPFDTELWLYNINTTLADVEYSWESPYGNDLIANDDDGAPGSYSLIVQVLDAGTYVIRVSYFSESSAAVGDYTIDVTIE